MGGVAGTIPLLAQRAASEGPRWTRAVGIIPPTPYEVIVRCGLAWDKARLDARGVGEKPGLFEHPTGAVTYA
jgi:hypothetical protein